MEEKCFEIRALEVHSNYAWDYSWMIRVLDYASQLGYNTVILHRNDILELLVYPGALFGYDGNSDDVLLDVYAGCFRKIYSNTPTRRSNIFNKNAYMRRFLAEAGRRGIGIYIENKELSFPDILPVLHPELMIDGHICPTHPFWKEYLRMKYTELFHDYPGIKGVITSVATSESRLSMKNSRCNCGRCKGTAIADWYRDIIGTMADIMSQLGKDLVIRDFVFDPDSHRELASVINDLPDDVIISLKNTPHDYYPTFPQNPRIGKVGNHRQWIEFDAMGQYFGLGIGIADLSEDYRRRLKHAKANGVIGAVFRTDWESLDCHSAFHTPNIINVYAGGIFSRNPEAESDEIYRTFLRNEGWCQNKDIDEEVSSWLKGILSHTWDITRCTVFANSCVFSDSSTLPLSLEHALWLAEEKNSLKDWLPEKSDALAPLKKCIEYVYREKEGARENLDRIMNRCSKSPQCIKEESLLWMKRWLSVNSLYLRVFTASTEAIMNARYIMETEENDYNYMDSRIKAFHDNIRELDDIEKALEAFWKDTDYIEIAVYMLLDPERVRILIDNLLALNIPE